MSPCRPSTNKPPSSATSTRPPTIDAAIDGARREIELLREYRTRLIADVVTGKLDVREAAAALPAEAADREDGAGMGRARVASRRGRERGPGLAGIRDLG